MISLTVLAAATGLIFQNIYAISTSVQATIITSNVYGIAPWSMIASSALSMVDHSIAKNLDGDQDNSPKYTTVSSSSETRTVRTGFNYGHGFKFINTYTNYYHVIPDKYIPDFIYDGDAINFQTYGRCGGMAFAALDYWYAKQRIPGFGITPKPVELCGNGLDDDYDGQIDENGCNSPDRKAALPTPPNNDPLSEYILQRLHDSLDISLFGILKGLMSVALTLSPASSVGDMEEIPRYIYLYFGPTENKGTSWLTGSCTVGCLPGVRPLTDREVIKATRMLDQQTPVVLGLVHNTAITQSHQVVAYGYHYEKRDNAYTFFIWDNNRPGMEVHATWYQGVKYGKLYYTYDHYDKVKGFIWSNFDDYVKSWKGFFVEDYEPKTPPVLVIDFDGDGIEDSKDNCNQTYNPDQKNTNGDEFGDVCQLGDQDKDGVIDNVDNCRWVANPDQNPDACKDVIL